MESIKFYNCNACGGNQVVSGGNIVEEDVALCPYCGKEVKTKNAKIIKNFNDFIEVLENNAIVEYSEKKSTIEKDFLKEQVKKLQDEKEEYTIFSMEDSEGRSYYITRGYHFVNVIGYHLVKGNFIIEDENDDGSPSLFVN